MYEYIAGTQISWQCQVRNVYLLYKETARTLYSVDNGRARTIHYT